MRTRINLRIGIIMISGTIPVDTINGTFLEFSRVRGLSSRLRIPDTILRHPLHFLNSKPFLNSEMTSSFFFSSTLNSRNSNVTLIQFNFWCTTRGSKMRFDNWTSPEVIKSIVAGGESSLFWIITNSFWFWTVMFYLIKFQFSICMRDSLQICFLVNLSALGSLVG